MGLVPVKRDGERLAFGAPPRIKTGPVDAGTVEQIASWLRIAPADIVDAQWVDNGPGWVAVVLPSVDAVLNVKPGAIEQKVGVVAKYDAGSPAAIELRAFFSVDGVTREDPVTGSLNASVAQWMLESGQLSRALRREPGCRSRSCGRGVRLAGRRHGLDRRPVDVADQGHGRALATLHPLPRHLGALHGIVDDEHELVIVVAVLHLDVHARIGHGAAELAELAGLVLPEALQEHRSHRGDVHADAVEHSLSLRTVLEEEVRDAATLDDPRAAAFDAHAGRAERLAHACELAGLVGEDDLDVVHASGPF